MRVPGGYRVLRMRVLLRAPQKGSLEYEGSSSC